MLLASPHAGFRFAFTEEICFQLPSGPAQTSGGWLNDCRMTAVVLSSDAIEPCEPELLAVIASPLFQSVSTAPVLIFTDAIPQPPSIDSPKSSFWPPEPHFNQLAEAFMPGVMFFASPPSAGTKKMSPPVEPSSLINPSMKAIVLPSGDHTGLAIWSEGL